MPDIKTDKSLTVKPDSKGKEEVNLSINILCSKPKTNNLFLISTAKS